ncbi:hypothetical protein [Chryseobacterium oranimense]|uniref:hypothetical protein n=1 Tax=Chryseobacterium oranimense TaxID=421058 RepID=UPI001114942E|nr:hypothetical protein [Chryseobacterium oranimense]
MREYSVPVVQIEINELSEIIFKIVILGIFLIQAIRKDETRIFSDRGCVITCQVSVALPSFLSSLNSRFHPFDVVIFIPVINL